MDFEQSFDNPDQLDDLAKFVKRITFDDAYRRADAGDYAGTDKEKEYREAQAYRFLTAAGKLEDYLAKIGF